MAAADQSLSYYTYLDTQLEQALMGSNECRDHWPDDFLFASVIKSNQAFSRITDEFRKLNLNFSSNFQYRGWHHYHQWCYSIRGVNRFRNWLQSVNHRLQQRLQHKQWRDHVVTITAASLVVFSTDVTFPTAEYDDPSGLANPLSHHLVFH